MCGISDIPYGKDTTLGPEIPIGSLPPKGGIGGMGDPTPYGYPSVVMVVELERVCTNHISDTLVNGWYIHNPFKLLLSRL